MPPAPADLDETPPRRGRTNPRERVIDAMRALLDASHDAPQYTAILEKAMSGVSAALAEIDRSERPTPPRLGPGGYPMLDRTPTAPVGPRPRPVGPLGGMLPPPMRPPGMPPMMPRI